MIKLKTNFSGKKKLYEIAEKRNCTGCGACAASCPVGCIEMVVNDEGFYYPEIDHLRCIGCNRCLSCCPKEQEDDKKLQGVFAGYSRNEQTREMSSSGGIFSHLAEQILDRKGVVFGTVMENEYATVRAVEQKKELPKLRGSKYVQSAVGNAYLQAEKFLKDGRWVLFTGTPCQIVGLKNYLRCEYDRLITVDFVCHGISSPRVLKKYLEEMGIGKQVSDIIFRDKTEGWKNFSMKVNWSDGSSRRLSLKTDIYLQSFLRNLNIRSSCFNCKLRMIHRKSDITLGDLWGAEEIIDGWKEDKGYSLIMIQSEKGLRLWETIQDYIVSAQTDLPKVIKHNTSIVNSPWDEYSRDIFFKKIHRHSLADSIKDAEKSGLIKKVGRKIWKINRR